MYSLKHFDCCGAPLYYEQPILKCYEPKKQCCGDISLQSLQLDQPELCQYGCQKPDYNCGCQQKIEFDCECQQPEFDCGSQKRWRSYVPSAGCGKGLDRASYGVGCFNDRGNENHGWNTRNSYCAQGRYNTDRSNRGSYGVGSVWRGQDQCLNFRNNCPDSCQKIEYCNECQEPAICNVCQRPALECGCAQKKVCGFCQKPALECRCWEKKDYDCGCFEEPQYDLGCYDEPKWVYGCQEKKLDLCNICQKPAVECVCVKKCPLCFKPKYLCKCGF